MDLTTSLSFEIISEHNIDVVQLLLLLLLSAGNDVIPDNNTLVVHWLESEADHWQSVRRATSDPLTTAAAASWPSAARQWTARMIAYLVAHRRPAS